MQDCSLVTLKNVGVLEEDVSTAIGVQVDGTFWVWIKDCAFNAKATSGPTIRMTALTPGSTGTGLVDIRDTIIAGHGMKIDPRVSTPQPAGNVTMTNVTTESMRDAFLTIDASHAYISGIHLTKIEVADNISMPALISIINADPGKVRNVSLKDSDSIFPYVPLVTGGSISGFNVEAGSTIDYPDKGWRIGADQRRYTLMRDGTIDAETPLVFSQMSPFIIPYQTFAFGQNPAGWTKGNATVTTGVMGPDGTLTAGTLTSSGGEKYIRFNSGAVTYAVGDWVLAGVWIRGESSTKPPYAYSSISLSGSGTARFDNATAQGFNIPGYAGYGDLNFPTQQLPSAWYPAIGYGKITSITGSTSFETVLDLKCTDTQPTSYWKQWAMRIPAGTMPDQEVIRLARSLRNMLPNVPAGSLGMYPDQTFYAGRIVSQRTTTFADADAAPSVSGGNLFKTANTGATTITQFDDGVDGQVIRILIDANTTIQNNANIKNRSGANVTGAANITESYVRISGAWYQLN